MIANGASLLSLGGSARLGGTCVLLLEVSGADSQQADIGFVLYRVTDCAHGKIVGSHTDKAQILSRCVGDSRLQTPVTAQVLWEKHTKKLGLNVNCVQIKK